MSFIKIIYQTFSFTAALLRLAFVPMSLERTEEKYVVKYILLNTG